MPTGYLFFRVWQTNADDRENTRLERQGIEYLTNLAPLTGALAEAESSILQGDSSSPSSLTAAVGRIDATDQRLGGALGTTQRWTNLRSQIANLPQTGEPTTIYQAHVEVGDLALGLFNTVRNNSGLIRDPESDIANLQQAVAVDLPNTVTQVSRMGDLALMLANLQGTADQKAKQQALLGPQFGAAVQFVNASVSTLTDDLQAAVDNTTSKTLSGNLVSTLDAFRRGVEALTRGANPGGTPNAATMATAQTQLQTALGGLSGVLLREMDGLLKDRQESGDLQRLAAIVAGAIVLLLVIGAVLAQLAARRRAGIVGGAGEATRDMPMPPPRQSMGTPGYANLIDPSPYGDIDSTRRERSGALR